jgi:hypothetical protein
MGRELVCVAAVDVVLSSDGRTAQFQFVKADGRTSFIDVPAHQVGAFAQLVQQALSGLYEKATPGRSCEQQGGNPPEKMTAFSFKNVRDVTRVEAHSLFGMSILSLLSEETKLDFSLNNQMLRDIIDRLKAMEAQAAATDRNGTSAS